MMPMHVLMEALAKNNALRRYAEAYDRFTEEEQLCRAENRLTEAEGAHLFALTVLRAYRAELDDPEPQAWD